MPKKIYDKATGKWYEIRRGFLGRLIVKRLKECSDKPDGGDALYMDDEGIVIIPESDDTTHYIVLEDYG
jgi:hypothetical protein